MPLRVSTGSPRLDLHDGTDGWRILHCRLPGRCQLIAILGIQVVTIVLAEGGDGHGIAEQGSIVPFHDQRGGYGHGPEDTGLVGLDGRPKRHALFCMLGGDGIFDVDGGSLVTRDSRQLDTASDCWSIWRRTTDVPMSFSSPSRVMLRVTDMLIDIPLRGEVCIQRRGRLLYVCLDGFDAHVVRVGCQVLTHGRDDHLISTGTIASTSVVTRPCVRKPLEPGTMKQSKE